MCRQPKPEDKQYSLTAAKDRAQLTATTAMSVVHVALLKSVIEGGPDANRYVPFTSLATGISNSDVTYSPAGQRSKLASLRFCVIAATGRRKHTPVELLWIKVGLYFRHRQAPLAPPHDAPVRSISWRGNAGVNVRQCRGKKYKRTRV